MAEKFYNYIDGAWCEPSGGEWTENISPANTDDIVGLFPRSTKEDLERAIRSAKDTFDEWRLMPAPKRGEIIKRAGDIMVERKEEISRQMTREMGKVLKETRGDTQEGIDTAYYAATEGRRLHGHTAPSELPNKFNMTVRRPIGVAGLITPWNFPMAIPTWKVFPALVCGNTVVIKPATDTPATVVELVNILLDAGLPPKVINLVMGSGSVIGNGMVEHPDVSIISFTGSSEVGKDIAARAGKQLKRVSLELGGKNGQVVMPDADLELALEGVLWGAYGTTGQRCTATSRLILHKDIHDKFVDMLVEAAEDLQLGNGLDERNDVGPLINEGQRQVVANYVEIGRKEGAKMLCGGEPYTEGDCKNGFFYKPTVFVDVKPTMRIFQEEIFGPVLSVIKVNDFDEAVKVHNNTVYGLSSSLYTKDVELAFKAMRDFDAGITYINGPTIGAECHMPFGGVKETGNGHREGGWEVYEFFSETKTIYVDFSGKLQKAQIDNQ